MWRVVVPVKRWDAAKSRLDVPPTARAALAQAMAVDTLSAIRNCSMVGHVTALASSDDIRQCDAFESVDEMLVQPPSASLAEAVTWALEQLPTSGRASSTAIIVSDLPALRPVELERALLAATRFERSMVVDRLGTGTTALARTRNAALAVRFGSRSASRHRGDGVVALNLRLKPQKIAGLSCDVDTLDDLSVARSLGLGEETRRVDAQLGSPT